MRNYEHLFILLVPMIVGLSLLVYLRYRDRKKMFVVIKGLVDSRAFKRSKHEGNLSRGGFLSLLVLNGGVVIGTFLTYVIYRYTDMSIKGFNLVEIFLIVFVLMFGYYWLKKIISLLLGYFSGQKEVMKEAFRYFNFFIMASGLLLLPFMFFLNYRIDESTEVLFTVINNSILALVSFLLLGTYLVRVFQEVKQGFQIKMPRYYLFLYFCTLEILPLVILIGLLVG